MAKVLINESTLQAIGDAIRNKTDETMPINVVDMANAISNIELGGNREDFVPDSAFVVTGDCTSMFVKPWTWFVNMYGKNITTNNITNVANMFNNSDATEIPFEINLGNTVNMQMMFDNATQLVELPKFNISETPYWNTLTYGQGETMFRNCRNLLRVGDYNKPFLSSLHNKNNIWYGQMFYCCDALEGLDGLSVGTETAVIDSNKFSLTFGYCKRLKDVIFNTDNGTPYVRKWKNQLIDLSMTVGYGITANGRPASLLKEKEVTDDASYQALKDDPDWYTNLIEYSRYNHDSAVRTINSLPDTSAYLAENGGTNTIKFKGDSGSATDGGAINTLTEEEIAVATAKGWTVTIV